MFYRFKEKGPAYGLGHTEGEIVEYDPKVKIVAMPLVPEVRKSDGKPTNRMILSKKEYDVNFLIEAGVIVPASDDDIQKYKAKKDVNGIADANAVKIAELESKQFKDRQSLLK